MSRYPMLEKLGVRVARMPRLLGGRAFVWQRDLLNPRFLREVDRVSFVREYSLLPGKLLLPGAEWASVLDAALAMCEWKSLAGCGKLKNVNEFSTPDLCNECRP